MHTVDGLLAIPRVGMGVGGLLLGTKSTGRIDILAVEPIDCSHALGPAFLLTKDELTGSLRLAKQVAKAHAEGNAYQVVGWYCSKTNGPLALSEADRLLYDVVCSEPWQVALLIKPSQANATTAVFSYRGHRSFGERESTFRLGSPHEFARQEDAAYQYPKVEPEPEPEPDKAPSDLTSRPLIRTSGDAFGPVRPSPVAHAERLAALDPNQEWPEYLIPPEPEEEPDEELNQEELGEEEPTEEEPTEEEPTEEVPSEEKFVPEEEVPAPQPEPPAPQHDGVYLQDLEPEAEATEDLAELNRPHHPLFADPEPAPEVDAASDAPKGGRWPLVLAVVVLLLASLVAAAWFTRDKWLPRFVPAPPVALMASSDWTGRLTLLWNADAFSGADHAALELADGKGAKIILRLGKTDLARGRYQYDCPPGTYSVTLISGNVADTITVKALAETYLPESGISK